MLWVKAFHIIFMVAWYAGLLYLPRLFVYHAMSEDETSRRRFSVMERKLFVIMTIGALGTAGFGLWLLGAYAWAAYSSAGWLHAKLALMVVLVAFHIYCWRIIADFKAERCHRSQRFFRAINEIPAVLLIAVVILVVVKPW